MVSRSPRIATGGTMTRRVGGAAAESRWSCARDVGCTTYVMPGGSTLFPAVWSPWSEPTTYHLMGSGVIVRMRSSIAWVAAGLPCPSAISTPSVPMTIRLTVVKPGCRISS